jgi:hypothetical protein
MRPRIVSGHPTVPGSIAAVSHAAASSSVNGLNSPHPCGPSSNMPSRMLVPPDLFNVGIAKANALSKSINVLI